MTVLPDPKTYNYGEEVKRIFAQLWAAVPASGQTPQEYQRLQEKARAMAIAPVDQYGRTINQPGYGSSVKPDYGKNPDNVPLSQVAQAAAVTKLIQATGPDPRGNVGRSSRPIIIPPPQETASFDINAGAGKMAGASTIAPTSTRNLKGAILGALGGFVTGGPAGAITGGIAGAIGITGSTPGKPACAPGFKMVNGQCVTEGISGAVQRILPGGQTGTMVDSYGEAVLGAWGKPALVPRQVGTITRNDGSTSPVLRCPRGAVLGIDNLCYQKGSKGLQRKWPAGSRPIISANDAKTLKKIGSLQERVKKAWQIAGKPGQTHTRRK